MACSGDDRLRACFRAAPPSSAPVAAEPWDATLAEARGETVYWNAWGGDDQVNRYIAWVGEQVRQRHGIELVHVKLTDTAEAVARVVAEKAAGRTRGLGRPDLAERRELRRDEVAGAAVRAVRRAPAELPLRRQGRQAHDPGRLHDSDRWPRRRPGAWRSSCSARRGGGRQAAALGPALLEWAKASPPGPLHLRRRPISSARPS